MPECQHPKDVQSTDLATGDLFCGDCGDVVEAYDHQPRRLSGDDAATVIAAHLRNSGAIKVGSVTIYGITPMRDDVFDVTARVVSKDGARYESFVLTRDRIDPSRRLSVELKK
ncbi:hypothetical protein SEA_SICARIUS2_54 [Arthrobacter phage Sicarius2]|uniref:Uncharacterized protein n=2 Tax=Sicariusvirus TaxID=3425006 RepID=A0A8F3EAE7_9CAUD|nr:hypothetical protein SEA_SICARIUS2_54 [Arthrobacter phage Sicarius2]WNM67297.1 hypothetical protein SEA_WYBORN_54 [Arthrobacter phage Wyborn]